LHGILADWGSSKAGLVKKNHKDKAVSF